MSSVTALTENVINTVEGSSPESIQAGIDLAALFDKSLKDSTFNDQHRAQLVDSCSRYRSTFSLSPNELGKCEDCIRCLVTCG